MRNLASSRTYVLPQALSMGYCPGMDTDGTEPSWVKRRGLDPTEWVRLENLNIALCVIPLSEHRTALRTGGSLPSRMEVVLIPQQDWPAVKWIRLVVEIADETPAVVEIGFVAKIDPDSRGHIFQQRALQASDIKRVRQDWLNGVVLFLESAAKGWKVSESTTVKTRRATRTDEDLEQVGRLRKKGMTYQQISEEMHIGRSTAERWDKEWLERTESEDR